MNHGSKRDYKIHKTDHQSDHQSLCDESRQSALQQSHEEQYETQIDHIIGRQEENRHDDQDCRDHHDYHNTEEINIRSGETHAPPPRRRRDARATSFRRVRCKCLPVIGRPSLARILSNAFHVFFEYLPYVSILQIQYLSAMI